MAMGVNYGSNKVRFPSPVPVGAKLRLGAKLLAVEDVAGGAQGTMRVHLRGRGGAEAGVRGRGHLPVLRCVWPGSARQPGSTRSRGGSAELGHDLLANSVERLGVRVVAHHGTKPAQPRSR